MARTDFRQYISAMTKKDPVAILTAFKNLLENGTDVEITNGLLFTQLQALTKMNNKLRDIYGEDWEEEDMEL